MQKAHLLTIVKFKQRKYFYRIYYYTYSISFTMLLSVSATNISNIWYLSNYGSDDNDCHSARTPCKNLQTVLDKTTDGAVIYVLSLFLALDMNIQPCHYNERRECCTVESSISYTITTYNETYFTPTCYSKSNHISFFTINFNFNKH